MFEILLTAVFVVLLVNVVVAFVVTARPPRHRPLAVVAAAERYHRRRARGAADRAAGPAASSRFPDVAVVLIGLASLTAVVRMTAARTSGAARGARTSPAPLGGGDGA
ncbi:hypothetical protein [Kocuria sp. CPCC 205261]|uniref:hypothetical protein n=1 Tax=Kocuria sp. CPCC 205261 TaxID=3073554 RepID=UPI0034D50123